MQRRRLAIQVSNAKTGTRMRVTVAMMKLCRKWGCKGDYR